VDAPSTRSFPAHPSSLGKIRGFIREHIEEHLTARAAEDLILAASEACANAVLHSGSDRVEVGWRADDDSVEVEIRDLGSFKRRVRMSQVEGPGGYGIPLMTALTDELVIQEGTDDHPGTTVRLVKRRGTPT
jgi:anti-sigma regulatory factor (Ser/Thr protein kinase)